MVSTTIQENNIIYKEQEETMAWALDEGLPIYPQLMDEIRRRIVTEVYKAGDRIPSVRELAAEAEVNANTMQKALSELEREELLITMRSTGRTVTSNIEKIKGTKKIMAEKEISRCMTYMKDLGYSIEEIQSLIAEYKD